MSFIYEHHLSEMLSLQEKNYNSVTEIAIHQTTKQVTINFGALVSRNACVCVVNLVNTKNQCWFVCGSRK